MKKLFLLLLPITLILCGCSDKGYYATSEELSKEISLVYSTIDRNEALMNEKINDLLQTGMVEETTRAEICMPMYERCIDNYFNDNCLSLYRDGNNIMCEIETGYSIPIREFKCNVCNGNYGMPINL